MAPASFLVLFFLAAQSAFAIGSGQLVERSGPLARSTVIVRWKEGGYCSGVLIAKDLVLTAAHCVSKVIFLRREDGVEVKDLGERGAAETKIYFGSYDGQTWDPNLEAEVETLRRYPGSRFVFGPDLGLIQLRRAAPTSFNPVKILLDENALKPDLPITIAGFGNVHDGTGSPEPSSHLLRSFQTLLKDITVSSDGRNRLQIYKSQELPWFKSSYAAGDEKVRNTIENAGMQSGDSGGPAFADIAGKLQLVGIASGYDSESYPVYEGVRHHQSWICDVAREVRTHIASCDAQ